MRISVGREERVVMEARGWVVGLEFLLKAQSYKSFENPIL